MRKGIPPPHPAPFNMFHKTSNIHTFTHILLYEPAVKRKFLCEPMEIALKRKTQVDKKWQFSNGV